MWPRWLFSGNDVSASSVYIMSVMGDPMEEQPLLFIALMLFGFALLGVLHILYLVPREKIRTLALCILVFSTSTFVVPPECTLATITAGFLVWMAGADLVHVLQSPAEPGNYVCNVALLFVAAIPFTFAHLFGQVLCLDEGNRPVDWKFELLTVGMTLALVLLGSSLFVGSVKSIIARARQTPPRTLGINTDEPDSASM